MNARDSTCRTSRRAVLRSALVWGAGWLKWSVGSGLSRLTVTYLPGCVIQSAVGMEAIGNNIDIDGYLIKRGILTSP